MIDTAIIENNKDKILNFNPTKEQIRKAERLFICMARYEAIEDLIVPLENRILKENVFYGSPDLDPDQNRITDRIADYLMSDQDFNKFLDLVYEERVKLGFKEKRDNCPLNNAEMDLFDAQREFINCFSDLTGITSDKIWKLDLRKKYIDLWLNMMAKFVNQNKILEDAVNGN